MKRADEEYCKDTVSIFLADRVGHGTVDWTEVSREQEPPDYYFTICGARLAVEITTLMEEVALGGALRMPQGLVGISAKAPETSTPKEEDTMTVPSSNPRPMIARIWRGRTTPARADAYARYLYEHGIKPLVEKALGVQMFREDRESESEFVTISYWESVEAMSRFAGNDPRRIHHLERDAEFLIELPSGVQILEIVASLGQTGMDARP
jgi:heme-degrading monooxygenase HmoA